MIEVDRLASKPVHVLLIDDDDGEAKAVERAFRKARIANPLIRAHDGVEALDMLRGTGGMDRVPNPRILLVDLNMPRMGGIELLAEIRGDPDLQQCVAFVLSTSSSPEDKDAAYDHNVAGYIVKERAGKDFLNLLALLDSYCTVVEMPVAS